MLAMGLQACTKSSSRHPTSDSRPVSHSPSSMSSQQNAEQQLLQTVEHAEQLGKGNPLILSSLYSLASYYRGQRQYDKAEHQYQKALQLKEQSSGPNHPDIAMILHNYADLLREVDRHAEAKNLAIRAASILANPPSKTHSK